MAARSNAALPKLPVLLEQKLTKTGYTRGATVREVFQNRVTRNNTVLINWEFWDRCRQPEDGPEYENGFIVLVSPAWYFETAEADALLAAQGVELGINALLLFKRRPEVARYWPESGLLPNGKPFTVATSRSAPLGGTYFARVAATVAGGDNGDKILEGFNATQLRGAGIRVYEYASTGTIKAARLQLECLVWMCADSMEIIEAAGMSAADVESRRAQQLANADTAGLLDCDRLRNCRVINDRDVTVCPLCKEPISAAAFMRRGEQAEGRAVHDLTITEISLFHIEELRVGSLQHKPYNLGWGHHFCNVVVKDAGILPTLEWMSQVLANQ